MPEAEARLLGKGGKLDLSLLEPPASPGGVTVLDLLGTEGPKEYGERALGWAEAVWEAWSDHHETVRRWSGA